MKRISLFLLSVAMGGTMFAKTVNQQTAALVAKNFMTTKLGSKQSVDVTLLSTQGVSGANTFYVFGINNNQGFVLVAADDIVKPILAYSTNNSFQTASKASPEVTYWMNGYSEQINNAVNNNLTATDATIAAWNLYGDQAFGGTASKPTNAVSPLLTTTWDQDTYYDIYTPGTGTTKTPVGCVATAMAQIMKYWNAPTHGAGSYTYTDPTYGTQTADFGAANYQWGLMPNSLSASTAQVSKNAISLIGYHCGVAVKMSYAPAGSGSQVITVNGSNTYKCAQNAFKNNFGYKTSIQGLSRASYADLQWDSILKNELDHSRPLLYAGFGSDGGHAFVFDGYDENDMFHINWGWAGMSNGYFTVNNLAPSALGIGAGAGNFNAGQQALIAIEPIQLADPLVIKATSDLTITTNSIEKGQPFTVNYGVANAGTVDFAGYFGAAIYKAADSSFVTYVKYNANQILLSGLDTAYTLDYAGSNSLGAGQYFIKAIYRSGSATGWSVLPDDGHINRVELEVTDTTTSNPPPTSIHDVTLNKSFTVYPNPAGNVINIDLSQFNGKVNQMVLNNVQGQKVWGIQNNTSSKITVPTYLLADGIYYLNIGTDQGIANKKIVIKH